MSVKMSENHLVMFYDSADLKNLSKHFFETVNYSISNDLSSFS